MAMNPRLLRPLATGFNPKSIPGLAVWFDASVASSVTLNGGNVSQWNDLSGNDRHATQATAGNQPSYSAAALNGKNVVVAQDSSRVLKTAAFPAGVPQTVFVVASTSGTNQGIFQRGTLNSVHALWRSTSTFIARRGSSFDATIGSSDGYKVFSCVFGASLSRIFVAGVQGTDNTTTATAGTEPVTTADRTLALFNLDSTLGMVGGIAEVLYYNRLLSTAERQRVERYLSRKWNTALAPTASNPEAVDWINAVYAAGSSVNTATANAVDDFVSGCKADGIWSAIKACCVLCGPNTLAGALVPLVGSAPTNTNFVSGDYNRLTGLKGNASNKSLNTNRLADADPVDDFHLSTYMTEANSGNLIAAGLSNAGAVQLRGDGASKARNAAQDAATATPTAFFGVSRSASASYLRRVAGSTATITRTSDGPLAENIVTHANGPAFYSDARIAFYSIGEALDLAALDTRVSALITAIGAS